jgi:hypothetical protein
LILYAFTDYRTRKGKYPMCSRPITQNGKTFACRKCNECIAARKNDWVARCMAEKQTSAETLVLELTYRNNPDGTSPDSAKAFRYKDVQIFFKRIRNEYRKVYGENGQIRYIIAGERGSKRKRVHWHLVMFADRPISTLGKWTDFVGKPLERMRFRKMDHWAFWDHGHIYSKEAVQGEIQYAIKYALKDQFNIHNSKGTMREAKAENHGASFFRMSKEPPIGFRWLVKKFLRLADKRALPPSLELKVPDYSGFWWPKAGQRQWLLQRLHELNELIKLETGRDAPQYDVLLSTLGGSEADSELLMYGESPFEGEIDHEEAFRKDLERERRTSEKARLQKKCGAFAICRNCEAENQRRGKWPEDFTRKRTSEVARQILTSGTHEQKRDATRTASATVKTSNTLRKPLHDPIGKSSLQNEARKDRPTCKERPDPAKAARGKGGSRPFIPWCKKTR